MKKPYNFLVFLVDEMWGGNLGCTGNPDVRTPNIDALAKDGVLYTSAYCNNTVCMPSRATIMTGLTPRQHGCVTNGTILPTDIPTLPDVLRKHGYKTASFGKIHLQPTGYGQEYDEIFSWESDKAWSEGDITSLPSPYYGFETTYLTNNHVNVVGGDYYNFLKQNHPNLIKKYRKENAYYSEAEGSWRYDIPIELHYNNVISNETINYILSQKEKPFYVHCSFPDPHMPFSACKPYSEMYDPKSIEINPTWNYIEEPTACLKEYRKNYLPNGLPESDVREITAQTYGMITHIDDCVGKIIDTLKQNSLYENTVVVFLADHGEYLGTHGLKGKSNWTYDEVVRVPFICRVPGNTARKTNEPVSLLDFSPTILSLAEIDQEAMDNRLTRHGEKLGLPGVSLKENIINGTPLEKRYTFIEYDEDWAPGPVFKIRVLIDEQYKMTLYGINNEGTLFDMKNDPHELTNLYYDVGYRDIVLTMKETLLNELIRTDRLIDQPRICGA